MIKVCKTPADLDAEIGKMITKLMETTDVPTRAGLQVMIGGMRGMAETASAPHGQVAKSVRASLQAAGSVVASIIGSAPREVQPHLFAELLKNISERSNDGDLNLQMKVIEVPVEEFNGSKEEAN